MPRLNTILYVGVEPENNEIETVAVPKVVKFIATRIPKLLSVIHTEKVLGESLIVVLPEIRDLLSHLSMVWRESCATFRISSWEVLSSFTACSCSRVD